MARSQLLALLGISVGLLVGLFTVALADHPGAWDDDTLARHLQVNKLIEQGKDLLHWQKKPDKAVELLEKNLHLIEGNKAYLDLLRNAYKAHIVNLFMKNQNDQANKYLTRLRILDPQAADLLEKNPFDGTAKAATPSVTPAVAPVYTKATGPGGMSKTWVGQPVGQAKTKALGKMDDELDDPFALEHAYGKGSTKLTLAQTLLADATAKFEQQKYGEARVKFEQAYLLDKGILATSGTADRWAYCQFQAVVDQLNQKPSTKVLAELEAQVKAGLALEPNAEMAKQGKKLLDQIAQRQSAGKSGPAAVTVKHLGKNAKGWLVAETPYFRIYHNQPLEFVEQVGQVAEQTRFKMTMYWFGASAKPWRDRGEIYLHATGKEYSQKTGVPPQSPGHSRIETDNHTSEVVSRQIELHCDNMDLLNAVLPHETTHVVLAGQFGSNQVPRWVDEGVAVLTEPKSKVDLHLKNLAHFSHKHELFQVGELIELKDYPHTSRVGAFYAQSVSLVQFLTASRGPQVFTKFVTEGLTTGFENALRKHYNIQSYAELQGQWVQHALSAKGTGYAQN
jgi:tetratricopeptide (TPR) repeat protein